MSKAILISIKPKWVAKILNGEKTIEIRKTCPVQLRGDTPVKPEPIDVYIYCTKEEELYKFSWNKTWYENFKHFADMGCDQAHALDSDNLSGKIVAKFTLNNCAEWHNFSWHFGTCYGCLTDEELRNYSKNVKSLYYWFIENLVIFDKPKELDCFSVRYPKADKKFKGVKGKMLAYKPLTKAPQSWCYVEAEELL